MIFIIKLSNKSFGNLLSTKKVTGNILKKIFTILIFDFKINKECRIINNSNVQKRQVGEKLARLPGFLRFRSIKI